MDWIGLAGLVVAVITLGFVIGAEVRARRLAPYVYVTVSALGTVTNGRGDLVAHVWEVTNEGTTDGIVRLVLGVHCQPEYTEERPPIKMLKAGEVKRLFVKASDIGTAWLLVSASPVQNPELAHLWWYAPEATGKLAEAHEQPLTRWELIFTRLPRLVRMLLDRFDRSAVGPGGAHVAHIRYRSLKSGAKRMDRALAIANREWPVSSPTSKSP